MLILTFLADPPSDGVSSGVLNLPREGGETGEAHGEVGRHRAIIGFRELWLGNGSRRFLSMKVPNERPLRLV